MTTMPCHIEPDSIWWKIVKTLRNTNRITVTELDVVILEVAEFVKENNGIYISKDAIRTGQGFLHFENDIDATTFLLRIK
jgi:hypothetical protein